MHTSAQVGIDPDTNALVGGGAATQTQQALENLAIVFKYAHTVQRVDIQDPPGAIMDIHTKATDCQITCANDANVVTAVIGAFESFFQGSVQPMHSIAGYKDGAMGYGPGNSMPELAGTFCSGAGPTGCRGVLASGQGSIVRSQGTTNLSGDCGAEGSFR